MTNLIERLNLEPKKLDLSNFFKLVFIELSLTNFITLKCDFHGASNHIKHFEDLILEILHQIYPGGHAILKMNTIIQAKI